MKLKALAKKKSGKTFVDFGSSIARRLVSNLSLTPEEAERCANKMVVIAKESWKENQKLPL